MTRKWYLIVGLALLLEAALVGRVSAATAGIPGIATTATAMLATIKGIGYALSIVFIILAVVALRHDSAIGGVLMGLLSGGLVVAVILFAEDIVNFINPNAASAFTGVWPVDPGLRQAWTDLTTQGLWYSTATWALARVRRVLHGR